VLLADADTYGGVAAQLLGMLDESVGLASASRAAAQGVLDAVTLARLSPYVLARLRVLTGITRPARWVELPSSSLDVVWEKAREIADVTVVDCGFSLEHDELLTYDTRAPQRNAATLSALGAADVVVVVGGADPVGLQRLVGALGDLDDAGVLAPRVVAVNRVRRRASGTRPAQAVSDVLARYAGVDAPVLLPDDPAACDRAVLEGRVIAECAPSSSVRTALTALAGRVRELLPVRETPDGAVVGGPVRREALERAH
jgi:MinD-like ATPase involved in chromosome partitioning or flagellar assembly